MVFKVDQWVSYQLTRTMISHIASSFYMKQFNTSGRKFLLIMQNISFFSMASKSYHCRMLHHKNKLFLYWQTFLFTSYHMVEKLTLP